MRQPSRTTDPAQAVHYIRAGRVVAFPTGTSYGLAVDALQGNALQRLRSLKHRPQEKSFTIFMDPRLVPDYFTITPAEEKIIKQYQGQAVTILLPPTDPLKHLAHRDRVGLRLIDHPLMAQLAKVAGTPLTATSANVSDQEPCHHPTCIEQSFPWQVEPATYDLSLAAILDGGELTASAPSTIIQVNGDNIEVIRPGAVSFPS